MARVGVVDIRLEAAVASAIRAGLSECGEQAWAPGRIGAHMTLPSKLLVGYRESLLLGWFGMTDEKVRGMYGLEGTRAVRMW